MVMDVELQGMRLCVALAVPPPYVIFGQAVRPSRGTTSSLVGWLTYLVRIRIPKTISPSWTIQHSF